MSGMSVKATLPLGVEVGGKKYKTFSIRPGKLVDSIRAAESLGDTAATATVNTLRYATLAQRISFDGLPQEQVTIDLLMDMYDRDALAIEKASDEVEKKLDALSSS